MTETLINTRASTFEDEYTIPHAEDSAREREFHMIAEAIPLMVWTARPDGVLDYYNRHWLEYTGFTVEQMINGGGRTKLIHPDDLCTWTAGWAATHLSGIEGALECRFRRGSDGMYRTHIVRAVPLRDEAGALMKWLGTCTDIQDQKEAIDGWMITSEKLELAVLDRAEELGQINAERDALLDSAMEGIYGTDDEGRCTFINRTGAEMLGYTREELLGKEMHELVHHTRPDGTPYPLEECPMSLAYLTGEVSRVRDELFWRKDGSSFPAEYAFSTAKGPARSHGAVITFRDITDLKRSEDALKASEERHRLVTETAREPFIAMSATGQVLEWNHQAELTFGWSREEIIGVELPETIMPAKVHDKLRRGMRHFLETGDDRHVRRKLQLDAVRRDGDSLRVELNMWPVRVGEQWLFNAFAEDVTTREAHLTEVTAQKEEIAAAYAALNLLSQQQLQAKDQVLSHVSHELRTPLTAAHQFVTILLDGIAGELGEEQREYLEIVLRNLKQLQAMIGDLLDTTRARGGKLTIDSYPLEPFAIVDDLIRILRSPAAEKNITLEVVRTDAPIVWADSARLRQILTNLLDNALKFMGTGTISVSIGTHPEHPGFVCFKVADNGPGIPANSTERIFERLYQIGEDVDSRRKGLGLGLYICRELAARMGGKLWVESELGHGATFLLTLPIYDGQESVRQIQTV